jgi:ABC-type dipeptide/oligopeptide/nickel transport system permease component
MLFANIITGAVILENVFAWPGLGKMSVDSMIARDFPVVQGITLLVAALVLMVNLLVDITYAYVDPQIRYQNT